MGSRHVRAVLVAVILAGAIAFSSAAGEPVRAEAAPEWIAIRVTARRHHLPVRKRGRMKGRQ